ncbi:MAG TPA: hypothetical protein GXZ52_06975 [Clostridiales bacterium]|nr:hypothetical protein [Clostridiales bacterium]
MLFFEMVTVYALGAMSYGAIELIWRGFTHWTMPLTGGLCFLFLYLIATRFHVPLWKKWVLSAAVITTVEFLVGLIVNIKLGWRVWDYSDRAFNLMGQICLLFTFYWFLLAIPGVGVCGQLRKRLFANRGSRREQS